MTASVSRYNQTIARFADGTHPPTATYIINLYSTFSFDAADTTKADAEVGATQLSTANGYTQDTKELDNVAITVVTTNDAKFDADDVSWTATGGAIGPARYAVVYNTTAVGSPPLFCIDFGENKTADDTTPFNINWHADGIITWTGA